jgi:hypothetical protein
MRNAFYQIASNADVLRVGAPSKLRLFGCDCKCAVFNDTPDCDSGMEKSLMTWNYKRNIGLEPRAELGAGQIDPFRTTTSSIQRAGRVVLPFRIIYPSI